MPAQIYWILIALVSIAVVAAVFHVYRIRRLDKANPLGLAGADIPPVNPPETLAELIPDSLFVEVDRAKLHYVQAGEGADIVLLHGIGASVYIWRFLFPLLQARHRVTAFDIAGFGKSSKHARHNYGLDSQADLIAKALSQIGIEKAILVGSSMGGAIGLWMAKKYPERFEQVVALGPATDSTFIPTATQYFAITAPLFRYTVNKHTIKLVLNYVVSRRQLITDKVVDSYLEPFRDRGEGLRAFIRATSILSDRRLPSGLADVKADVLVIWGANDYMVPRFSMNKLMRILPRATFVEHESGGHHIMEDEPIYIARQIETFLAPKS